ncbi:uncharacterized protein I303_102897 [Kwoniella dejecticola CBS 10117]|uniref:Uncharacterized protein n=1 Tax=Kwoniella dejecticola CBS 10117 TaxID=1296121 RepID=A0A1A6AA15_9TREE|nr:uncharacterized protein I303_02917 [Kwoniella dejecticola CBS 10117]OBR86896.1 hypothetical protein I303_02917 [Kwoniella dejecticola CBS 10117]
MTSPTSTTARPSQITRVMNPNEALWASVNSTIAPSISGGEHLYTCTIPSTSRSHLHPSSDASTHQEREAETEPGTGTSFEVEMYTPANTDGNTDYHVLQPAVGTSITLASSCFSENVKNDIRAQIARRRQQQQEADDDSRLELSLISVQDGFELGIQDEHIFWFKSSSTA